MSTVSLQKTWASRRGRGRMKHVMLKYMFVQDVVEKKSTNLAYINTKLNKADLMTKCHTSEAHKRGCAMLGLRAQQRRGGNSLETESRRSVAEVMEQREREVKRRSVRKKSISRDEVSTSFFIAMSSEFTFVDNSDDFYYFPIF